LNAYFRLLQNTAQRLWQFLTTKLASAWTRTNGSRWQKKIVQRAADHGIPASDVVVDPLVMPIGAMGDAGRTAFKIIRRLREELKVNTTCGASNVSFGIPARNNITGTFLAMAIGAGMTSAIMNPLHEEVKTLVMAADVLVGNDENCSAWIRANRDPNEVNAERSARNSRGRRRTE